MTSTTTTNRRRLVFHRLTVAAVSPETPDSVTVTFDVPPALADEFRFRPGQHLTVRCPGDGTEARRSYSLCNAPGTPLRIGVRRLDGGQVSTWLCDRAAVGEQIEVLPPLGGFVLLAPTGQRRRLGFVAAGSGITPVLSMISAALADDPDTDVALLALNRTTADTMFVEELHSLKSRFPQRFQLTFSCTREQRDTDPLGHRPTRADLERLLAFEVLPPADDWFLCGPAGLLSELESVLRGSGVAPERIHRELFTTDRKHTPRAGARGAATTGTAATVTFLGRSTSVAIPPGATLLEAARTARTDLPYSCEAGVCSTCRALVRRGDVEMAESPGLTAQERADGFVLTCRATAASTDLELDFDV
jgi:ring-1,2-phenylacetyl-CoA epoxidase subunit PaaE